MKDDDKYLRATIATMVLNGILSRGPVTDGTVTTPKDVCDAAVIWADTLIKSLNERKPK